MKETTKEMMDKFIDRNKDSMWFMDVAAVLGEERAKKELCSAFLSDDDCVYMEAYIWNFDPIEDLFVFEDTPQGEDFWLDIVGQIK